MRSGCIRVLQNILYTLIHSCPDVPDWPYLAQWRPSISHAVQCARLASLGRKGVRAENGKYIDYDADPTSTPKTWNQCMYNLKSPRSTLDRERVCEVPHRWSSNAMHGIDRSVSCQWQIMFAIECDSTSTRNVPSYPKDDSRSSLRALCWSKSFQRR